MRSTSEIHAEKAWLEKALDEMEERSKALEKIIAELCAGKCRSANCP